MSEQNRKHDRQDDKRTDGQQRKRKPKKKGSFWGRFFKVFGTLILIGLTTGALLSVYGAIYIKTVIMPVVDDFITATDSFVFGENSVMYYTDKNTGEKKELVTLLNTTDTIWVEFDEIPQDLLDAAVAIEDQRFYTHSGVDWKRTANAVLIMMTGDDIQGGSTITQQVVKNTTQYDDVTVKRKITEIFSALAFDAQYSKEETLVWYLNIIYLGENCEGVGAAAYKYFGKDVSQLSLAECASLISITNNPSIYSPYGELKIENEETGEIKTSRDYNKERQELVLSQMLIQGYITQQEHDDAVAEELQFVRTEGEKDETTIYTWYEEQVIRDVRNDLMDQYGYSAAAANLMLSSGGLSIDTLVDMELQAIVEDIYYNRENLDYTSPSGEQLLQSAVTVLDNDTGDLVALAGRMGDKTGNLLRNLATDAPAQPGSAIKPISTYAPALEMGLITPYSVLDDYPYQLLGGNAWPVNVDRKYRGLVTADRAVANSYNTVAVSTLSDLVTVQTSFQFMENRFRVALVDARTVNGNIVSDLSSAPLALGGLTDGITTRDMAEAYTAFATGGIYKESRTYSQVRDINGKVILENIPVEDAILKESTAHYMNQMLESVVDYGTGTAAKLSGMDSAGKSGTTDNKFDRWFVGYTPYYTAAVWVGYEYDERITAPSNTAVKMWSKVMAPIHENLPEARFETPDGLVSFKYCLDSGLLPTDLCQTDPRGIRVKSGKLFRDDIPTLYCTKHTDESVLAVCIDSPILNSKGESTGQYNLSTDTCAPDSIREYAFLDYIREPLGNAKTEDDKYLYVNNEDLAPCPVHGGLLPGDPEAPWLPALPEPEDPLNPSLPDPNLPIPELPDPNLPTPELPDPNLPTPEPPDPELPVPDLPDTENGTVDNGGNAVGNASTETRNNWFA